MVRVIPIALILALGLILAPGCALKGLAPADQALVLAEVSLTAYEATHTEYLRIYAAYPDRREWLESKVAPVLDKSKRAVLVLGGLALAWARSGVQPDDWTASQQDVINTLGDAARLMREDEI